MTEQCYAHSKKGLPREQWHRLEDHLRGTGGRAQEFAAKFGCGRLGWYAGLWHDLGKYASDWQEFIHVAGEDASSLGEETPDPQPSKRRRGPDHSTAGAIHAREVVANRFLSKVLSFVIASHHGGLPNEGDLDRRLLDEQKRERYALTLRSAEESIVSEHDLPCFPAFFPGEGTAQEQKRRYEMMIRMIFSSLVDADYLDTEHFMEREGERSAHRGVWPALSDYESPLLDFLETIERASTASLHLREARSGVLLWCREAAGGDRGVFTLTVPTGGGKTLSSLAFALRHARVHGLERVIIALPFLSILDQTASILRSIFERHLGVDVLVEHHSNITPERDTTRNRLATENWDAPLIVTTQVQLFESLFARRTSDCRKLHNLANSVIILDEVQTLPVGLLDPILDVLQQLRDYGTTLVLTTATQPAFHSRMLGPTPFHGLSPQPREIVPPDSIDRLFATLRRVEVTWPVLQAPIGWPDLADAVAAERQVLAIVHRRADAAELWQAVNERSSKAFHLSALMCPAHRRNVLTSIRDRLKGKHECRVISTQLVEAGVDVDFPVVYRAMAGLESLAQSAGRCNREGNLDSGSFRVFRAPTQPVGPLKHHKEIAETMLAFDPGLDLFAPETFRGYFDRLYAESPRDVKNVQVARQSLQFEETADRFRMIDEATTTVFVPFDDRAARAIAALRAAGPSRDRFRALQPYGVAVYPDALERLKGRGAVEVLHDAVWILASGADYDNEHLGLLVDREAFDARIV
jgi:CRISPR-associated endonuclease/helicase Cas3